MNLPFHLSSINTKWFRPFGSLFAYSITIFVLTALFTANATPPGEILFRDDFRDSSSLDLNYTVEGGMVSISDGRLHIQANPAAEDTYPKEAGIWIKKTFEEDLSIEFEMTSLSAHRSATDLQLFLFFNRADGSPVEKLFTPNKPLTMKTLKAQKGLIAIDFANTAERDGKVLTGTLINSPTCLLIYDCPSGSLLTQAFASEFYVGKLYKIKVEYRNHNLFYYINGALAAQAQDPEGEKRSGKIGFRTYLNDLVISNLVIRKMP